MRTSRLIMPDAGRAAHLCLCCTSFVAHLCLSTVRRFVSRMTSEALTINPFSLFRVDSAILRDALIVHKLEGEKKKCDVESKETKRTIR